MTDLIYKQDKTRDDVDILLARYKNIVYYMLNNMRLQGDQDAESAAYEALWDAIEQFDIYCTVPFENYACRVIQNAINDVLRKRIAQKRNLYVAVELTDNINIFYTDDVCTAETIVQIDKHFEYYINNCITGSLAKNILKVWRSSTFEMSASEIAKACNTTASYVGRVQCAFRAYLAQVLKE